ncbi:MAG TPA: hypothetical protein VEI73_11465 [Candidatus Acidoferrum sp.]|nr:hypothetical protein [Candidatus Acidoferrum sp.]
MALANDLTTMPSAVSGVMLREVAISLTSSYLAPAFRQAVKSGSRGIAILSELDYPEM